MAQRTRVWKIILGILVRVAVVCATIYVAALSGLISLDILEKYLGYKTPDGFFGFTLADDFVSLDLGLVFFSGIFFGSLGKWWDYAFIGLFIVLGVWEYSSPAIATTMMFVGLGVAALLGNAIGFGLKVLRKRYFPKFDI